MYQVECVADKFCEYLPNKFPFEFSYFRYLGFHVVDEKKEVIKGKHLQIQVCLENEKGDVLFHQTIASSFRGGLYYMQELDIASPGNYVLTAHGSSTLNKFTVEPYQTEITVGECFHKDVDAMEAEYPLVFSSPLYGNFRKQIYTAYIEDRPFDIKQASESMKARKSDLSWYFRTFYNRIETRSLQAAQQIAFDLQERGKRQNERKQIRPSTHYTLILFLMLVVRSATEGEHLQYFSGKQRELRKRENGKYRIFTNENLSGKQFYRSIRLTFYCSKPNHSSVQHESLVCSNCNVCCLLIIKNLFTLYMLYCIQDEYGIRIYN